ncbi:MAG: DUF1778 domain-containing protein [Cyanobacteria bacterium J06597_1]
MALRLMYGYLPDRIKTHYLVQQAMASSPKQMARLEARVDPEIKARLQLAADLQGCTLTDFVVASTHEAALRIIERHSSIVLDRQDSEAFVDSLLNPPQPNQALIAAATAYKQSVSSR